MGILLSSIIFLPLISAVTNGLLGQLMKNCVVKWVAALGITLPALLSIYLFVTIGVDKHIIKLTLAHWISIGDLKINWSIYVDQLTVIMFFLITTVSAVVHLYSFGYMENDRNLHKFLSYLSLFSFAMLMLVCADNFLQLFFGWEGVGVCSYLLIGYYFHKDSANQAAMKAFIVNRVSDFAFVCGIALIIIYTGHVNFQAVFAATEHLLQNEFVLFGINCNLLDIICLLLFIGCMGKSAQIGLHVWLPDAMEGPTPVSALIHAATMVTAGVFLVVRCSFLFEHSPVILNFIAIIGGITCLFAALIAIAQTDLKKIIAYSTCSQLGYMFFACGVSAYQAAMFHLVTHGFFKALLFLSAGNVIHATQEKDLRQMGDLRSKMPLTYTNFWIGSLAIIGIYPFAGFYSKDLILESAFVNGSAVGQNVFILGLLAAILTAIYSMKIIMMAFHGDSQVSREKFEATNEVSCCMNMPLLVLAAGALFAGMFGYYILDISNPYGFFANVIYNHHKHPHDHVPLFIETLPMVLGMFGMVFGYFAYKNAWHKISANRLSVIHSILKRKFFFDEVYDVVWVKGVNILALGARYFDKYVIDMVGPGFASLITNGVSRCICKIQTGYIYNYVFYIMLSIVLYISFVVYQFLQTVIL